MDTIRLFLNPGWVSSAIGIVSLLVALMIYRASIVGARPTYQRRALRLIGRDEAALPNEVEIVLRARLWTASQRPISFSGTLERPYCGERTSSKRTLYVVSSRKALESWLPVSSRTAALPTSSHWTIRPNFRTS